VDVCAGLIFVNLDPEPAQSLQEFLGSHLVERLERLPVAKATDFCEYVYELDANWKLDYDNFQESYHLKFIHPRTGAAAYTTENPFGYPENYGFYGPHRSQHFWPNYNPDVTTAVQSVVFPRVAQYATEKGLLPDETNSDYYALFPAFFIIGSPTQHFSHVVYPISTTRSRGVIRVYWIGEEETASERFAREYIFAIARDVHAEDVTVIRAGQRGLNSGALEHIHFQSLEGLCRHLYNVSSGIVEAYKAECQAKELAK
jgi:phenylpropionate dioxygenase-like ring-hydroxylating dioxygenase large terminal subunit